MTIERTKQTGKLGGSRGGQTAGGAKRLRLVGRAQPPQTTTRAIGQPLTGPTDPRWVLAVRTAEQLQGAVLSPDRRQKLLRLGELMGLTPFDSNLVIAIVQDQARRGFEPHYCPTAGESQLALIPLPQTSRVRSLMQRQPLLTAALIAMVIGLELLAINALLMW